MGKKVYANGREISCKAGSGQSIAAFPDVCLSPPSPPAGPVPIPYPLTAQDSDTDQGSKNVKIDGKPVMLKDQSNFKTCTGDEAATKSLGMGVITHSITGKVFFVSWSMDVKIEGQNAVRHLDMMTHNHQSEPGQTPPWPFMESMTAGDGSDPCEADKEKEKTACKDYKPNGPKDPCPPLPGDKKPGTAGEADAYSQEASKNECLRARRCQLQPYSKTEKGKGGCCDGQTGHHLVEASAFHEHGRGGMYKDTDGRDVKSVPLYNCSRYDAGDAPSICVEGTNHGHGTHGLMHTFQSAGVFAKDAAGKLLCPPEALLAGASMFTHETTTVAKAQKSAAAAVTDTFPESACAEKCIEAQLANYHEKKCGMTDPTKIKAVATCKPDDKAVAAARTKVQDRLAGKLASGASAGGGA
jgi:hypothetical protein